MKKNKIKKDELTGIKPDSNDNVFFIAKKTTRLSKKGAIASKLSSDGNYELINQDYKYVYKEKIENNKNWKRIDFQEAKPLFFKKL